MLAEADSSYNTTTEKQNADANELKTKCIYCVTTDGAQIQKEQWSEVWDQSIYSNKKTNILTILVTWMWKNKGKLNDYDIHCEYNHM